MAAFAAGRRLVIDLITQRNLAGEMKGRHHLRTAGGDFATVGHP
jgi:hypothetical protein